MNDCAVRGDRAVRAFGPVDRHPNFGDTEPRVVLVQQGRSKRGVATVDVRIDHSFSALSQIVRNEVPTRGRPRPNENWCLWILCASSIPAIVTAA
jgi:hypothetical protein